MWLYLAVVLDAWSRRIVGWAMAPHLRAELVEDALAMAISRHRPKGRVDPSHRPGLAVYVSGLREAVPRSGDRPIDGLGEGLLDRVRFRTAADARREVFSFIEASTTPSVFTRPSATGRPRTSRKSTVPRETSRGPSDPRSAPPLTPMGGDNRIHFRHHQPQRSTVRESGAGPPLRVIAVNSSRSPASNSTKYRFMPASLPFWTGKEPGTNHTTYHV